MNNLIVLSKDTSLQAYIDMQNDADKLSKQEALVYYFILNNPDCSDREIKEYTGLEISSVTARRNSLMKQGLIHSIKTKRSETGKTVCCWRLC